MLRLKLTTGRKYELDIQAQGHLKADIDRNRVQVQYKKKHLTLQNTEHIIEQDFPV